MKYLKSAIIVTNILWILFILISILAFTILVFLLLDNHSINFPSIIITTDAFENPSPHKKYSLIIMGISCWITLGAIYHFKKVLKYFKMVRIFDDSVILHLKKAAYFLCTSAIFSLLSNFILSLFINSDYAAKYAPVSSSIIEIDILRSSVFFELGIGLFFLVLAEVFTKGKAIQEENDLTI